MKVSNRGSGRISLHAPDVHLWAIGLVSQEFRRCICRGAALGCTVSQPVFSLNIFLIAQAKI